MAAIKDSGNGRISVADVPIAQLSIGLYRSTATAFLFNIKDKTNLKMMQKFLGVGDRDAIRLKNSMERIEKYQVVLNLKEFELCKLFSTAN